MSDAHGFGSGGVSAVLTVGPSQGRICNTTSPGKSPRNYDMIASCDFARCRLYLSIEYPLTTVQVCRALILSGRRTECVSSPFTVSDYSKGVQPVSLYVSFLSASMK